MENYSKKVVLLDRDGVINKRPPRGDYVKKWQEFEFLPGAIEAIRLLNEKDYEVYIVTNQAGVGRKLMSEEDLKEIHSKMEESLNKSGAKINGIYYCPHEMKDNCDCRKPKPGMLIRAAKEHCFDLKKSTFIGDDEKDYLVSKAVGCKSVVMGRDGNSLYEIVGNLT